MIYIRTKHPKGARCHWFIESELLGSKKEKSPTYCNFEIFTMTPNLTSNSEIHKNIGDNFDCIYTYVYA